MSDQHTSRPWVPHTIRRLSVPILLLWVGIAALNEYFCTEFGRGREST